MSRHTGSVLHEKTAKHVLGDTNGAGRSRSPPPMSDPASRDDASQSRDFLRQPLTAK
ncbi:hypothetical protein LY76DRAFT_687898 [Colletotrichum caudatum]|nr:hypothetical protein LY76DRAFT_687898 [Colletotrichum caudatum]